MSLRTTVARQLSVRPQGRRLPPTPALCRLRPPASGGARPPQQEASAPEGTEAPARPAPARSPPQTRHHQARPLRATVTRPLPPRQRRLRRCSAMAHAPPLTRRHRPGDRQLRGHALEVASPPCGASFNPCRTTRTDRPAPSSSKRPSRHQPSSQAVSGSVGGGRKGPVLSRRVSGSSPLGGAKPQLRRMRLPPAEPVASFYPALRLFPPLRSTASSSSAAPVLAIRWPK